MNMDKAVRNRLTLDGIENACFGYLYLPDDFPFRDTFPWETSMRQARFESCMEACLACATACRASAQLFRDLPGKAECVHACRDCADHCVLCCSDLRDNSPLLVHSSRTCAFACDRCALECERHNADHIERCLTACRRCAEECRKVRQWLGEMDTRRFRIGS